MSISPDLFPTVSITEDLPTEWAIKALAGAFHLYEMHVAASKYLKAILIHEKLVEMINDTSARLYDGNHDMLAVDLVNNGIISHPTQLPRLQRNEFSIPNQEGLNTPSTQYPIVGIVGPGNAGKGTIGLMISKIYPSLHYPLSDRLREVAMALGDFPPYSLSFLREINNLIKPVYGYETFVRWTLDRAKRSASYHSPIIISIDGFRSFQEAEWFLLQPNTMLVSVEADPKIRFSRGKNRNQGGEDTSDFKEFQEGDEIEAQWINPILPLAQHRFRNNGSLVWLNRQLRAYLAVKLADL